MRSSRLATNVTEAAETLPEEWEGINIVVEETGELQLV